MSNTVTVDGRLRLMSNNRTVVLTFYYNELYRLIQHSRISAIAIPAENLLEVRITLTKARTNLYTDGRYGACLAVTKYFPKNVVTATNRIRNVKVLIDVKDFGLLLESSIDDQDGKLLFESLTKIGFNLYPKRSTCNNQLGDLLVSRNNLLYSIHITRFNPTVNRLDNRLRLRHYIIGKIAFQTFNAKATLSPKCVIILHSDLFIKKIVTEKVLDFFNALDLMVMFSNFSEGWEQAVAENLLKLESSRIWCRGRDSRCILASSPRLLDMGVWPPLFSRL
jgi:hypothetical protein